MRGKETARGPVREHKIRCVCVRLCASLPVLARLRLAPLAHCLLPTAYCLPTASLGAAQARWRRRSLCSTTSSHTEMESTVPTRAASGTRTAPVRATPSPTGPCLCGHRQRGTQMTRNVGLPPHPPFGSVPAQHAQHARARPVVHARAGHAVKLIGWGVDVPSVAERAQGQTTPRPYWLGVKCGSLLPLLPALRSGALPRVCVHVARVDTALPLARGAGRLAEGCCAYMLVPVRGVACASQLLGERLGDAGPVQDRAWCERVRGVAAKREKPQRSRARRHEEDSCRLSDSPRQAQQRCRVALAAHHRPFSVGYIIRAGAFLFVHAQIVGLSAGAQHWVVRSQTMPNCLLSDQGLTLGVCRLRPRCGIETTVAAGMPE